MKHAILLSVKPFLPTLFGVVFPAGHAHQNPPTNYSRLNCSIVNDRGLLIFIATFPDMRVRNVPGLIPKKRGKTEIKAVVDFLILFFR